MAQHQIKVFQERVRLVLIQKYCNESMVVLIRTREDLMRFLDPISVYRFSGSGTEGSTDASIRSYHNGSRVVPIGTRVDLTSFTLVELCHFGYVY